MVKKRIERTKIAHGPSATATALPRASEAGVSRAAAPVHPHLVQLACPPGAPLLHKHLENGSLCTCHGDVPKSPFQLRALYLLHLQRGPSDSALLDLQTGRAITCAAVTSHCARHAHLG